MTITKSSSAASPSVYDITSCKFLSGILNPLDEFQYWEDAMNSSGPEGERAKCFYDIFKPLVKNYSRFENLTFEEFVDTLETTQDVFDEIWKQSEVDPYPETKMKHLLDVVGE